MNKTMNRQFAALAVSAVMLLGGVGIAKIASPSKTASAATGTYSKYALNVSTGEMGIGAENSAKVDVTNAEPATLTLSNVPAGQYMIVAKVTAEDAPWIDLAAAVSDDLDEEGYPRMVFLSENDALGAFTGVITVNDGSTVTLSTYSDYALKVEAYLMELGIGEFNDYFLNDIRISKNNPKTIAFSGASGTYIVSVDAYGLEEGAEIMFNGEALTLTPDMYNAYTGRFGLTNGKDITLSTTNEATLTVSLSLRPYITVTEELPMAEGDAKTFNIYETQTFVFEVEDAGYYTFSANSNVENAMFSYLLLTNPNNYSGVNFESKDYPVYLNDYTPYYLTVSYNGVPWEISEVSPDTADAWFTISSWKKPTLELDKDTVYVPVTAEGEKTVAIAMDVAPGTYDLNLGNIPFEIMFGGYTVTAHFGDYAVELEWGYAQITVTEETSIYFTTNYTNGFTAGVTLNTPMPDYTIGLYEEKEISLAEKSSAVYYLEDLAAGTYQISLILPDGAQVQIDASTSELPVVSAGETVGTFVVAEDGTYVALEFSNLAETYVEFTVVVIPVYAD